jgi:hypothetical protein
MPSVLYFSPRPVKLRQCRLLLEAADALTSERSRVQESQGEAARWKLLFEQERDEIRPTAEELTNREVQRQLQARMEAAERRVQAVEQEREKWEARFAEQHRAWDAENEQRHDAEEANQTLRAALEYVVTKFEKDEAAGYRSRDRQFAIEILRAALASSSSVRIEQEETNEKTLDLLGGTATKGLR